VAQDYAYEQVADVVDKLPVTAINYRLYYCLSDGKCYGYVNDSLNNQDDSMWGVEGWLEARDAVFYWWPGESYGGTTTDPGSIDVTD
jgi:hypothetical protein